MNDSGNASGWAGYAIGPAGVVVGAIATRCMDWVFGRKRAKIEDARSLGEIVNQQVQMVLKQREEQAAELRKELDEREEECQKRLDEMASTINQMQQTIDSQGRLYEAQGTLLKACQVELQVLSRLVSAEMEEPDKSPK